MPASVLGKGVEEKGGGDGCRPERQGLRQRQRQRMRHRRPRQRQQQRMRNNQTGGGCMMLLPCHHHHHHHRHNNSGRRRPLTLSMSTATLLLLLFLGKMAVTSTALLLVVIPTTMMTTMSTVRVGTSPRMLMVGPSLAASTTSFRRRCSGRPWTATTALTAGAEPPLSGFRRSSSLGRTHNTRSRDGRYARPTSTLSLRGGLFQGDDGGDDDDGSTSTSTSTSGNSRDDLSGSGVRVFRCEESLEGLVERNEAGLKKTAGGGKDGDGRHDDPLRSILMDGGADGRRRRRRNNDNNNPMSTISLLEPILYEQDESQLSLTLETALKWTPVTIPVIAFWLYDPTALFFSTTLASLTSKSQNWVAVDGGAYQARIITPAINGIVVQAIAILFAVLIGNTIDNLRNRQKDICDCIQMEATQLRILMSLLDVMGGGQQKGVGMGDGGSSADYNDVNRSDGLSVEMQQSCRQYLLQYTSRLIAEGHENTNIEALSGGGSGGSGGDGAFASGGGGGGNSNESELNGILAELNRAAVRTTSTTPPGTHFVINQSHETTRRLLETRSKRLTALASTFPPLHYIIISTLALSICVAFLMETDQDILVFLNAIQLRLLWTTLVGTFCALGVVLYDLGHPFRGSYQVSKAVNQLYGIRLNLKRSWKETEEQEAMARIKADEKKRKNKGVDEDGSRPDVETNVRHDTSSRIAKK